MSLTELKRPAFYAHFRDRHDLALRVAERITGEVFAMASHWLDGDQPLQDARSALEGIAAVYVEHGPVLRALTEAAASDAEVERSQRQLLGAFIDATAQHIRDEQAVGRVHAQLDADESARALVWLNERYLSEALGREPRADPSTVVDVLHRVWTATLYSPLSQ